MTKDKYKKTNIILGEGSYKTVYKAIEVEEGKEVAYNKVRIKQYESEMHTASSFSNEIALLKNIDHPNILKIFDYWFEGDDFVFVTELMTGGTLKDYLSNVDSLSLNLIKKWGRQILDGLNHLHTLKQPIIHRDIKNENIFINSMQGEIKIGDLGIAKEKKHKRYTLVGTPNFMAREMFEGYGYDEKVDIYAFGMALIEMYTGEAPYSECKRQCDVKLHVLKGMLPSAIHEIENNCLKNLILNCLTASPNRFTAKQCLEHHFFDPANDCEGDCLPKEAAVILPLEKEDDAVIYLISYTDTRITLQLQIRDYESLDDSKFIKFDYDIVLDTVEKVTAEFEKLKLVKNMDKIRKVLEKGIERVLEKKNRGCFSGGLIEVDVSDEGEPGWVIKRTPKRFGTKTMEIMDEIANEMREEEELIQQLSNNSLNSNVSHANQNNNINNTLVSNSSTISTINNSNDGDTIKEAAAIYKKYMAGAGSSEALSIMHKTSPVIGHEDSEEPSLGRAFELARAKYFADCSIDAFLADAAIITGRPKETVEMWADILKSGDISTVGELRILCAEDWEKLPLTVFASRVLQNMLYGIGGAPKEKVTHHNRNIKEYENSMNIEQFVESICNCLNRTTLAEKWSSVLMAQDIRTVGELKGLAYEDWNRIGLSIYAYRILKNVILKKGCNEIFTK